MSNESKHTPGEWYAAGRLLCATTDRGQVEIATFHDDCEYEVALPGAANALRGAVEHNALRGIPDPAAFVAAARALYLTSREAPGSDRHDEDATVARLLGDDT